MNRVIKFRGKRIDTGEWVEGFYWASLDPTSVEDKWRGHYIHNGVNIQEPWKVHPSTVGQFTGLVDKNGKEIYEGDVVEVGNKYGYYQAKVYWDKKDMTYNLSIKDFTLSTYISNHLKTIGNIHDNPELL
jgi:uncharacterized phage protein (TIGR01671 family)